MDAVEFLKQFGRLCGYYSVTSDCEKCPMLKYDCCRDTKNEDAACIAIIEQWAKAHPIKTRQSELLRLFPNTPCYPDGCIDMCPCEVGCLLMEDDDSVCAHDVDGVDCGKCKRDFWLEEID